MFVDGLQAFVGSKLPFTREKLFDCFGNFKVRLKRYESSEIIFKVLFKHHIRNTKNFTFIKTKKRTRKDLTNQLCVSFLKSSQNPDGQ